MALDMAEARSVPQDLHKASRCPNGLVELHATVTNQYLTIIHTWLKLRPHSSTNNNYKCSNNPASLFIPIEAQVRSTIRYTTKCHRVPLQPTKTPAPLILTIA